MTDLIRSKIKNAIKDIPEIGDELIQINNLELEYSDGVNNKKITVNAIPNNDLCIGQIVTSVHKDLRSIDNGDYEISISITHDQTVGLVYNNVDSINRHHRLLSIKTVRG